MAKNMTRRAFPRGGVRTRLPLTIYRRSSEFSPADIEGLALWLDASSSDLYTTDAGPVVAVTQPTDIAGCVGWWDASDAGSITESGGLVSQWNDKSTAGNHATASSTARPTTGTRSLNGKNVIDFDGTANAMATSLADTATQTVLFVAVSDVASSSGRLWSYGTTNRGVFSDSGTWAFWRQQTSGAILFGATASATSPSVACALFTSNSSLTTFGNGAQGTTNDPVDSSGASFNIGKETTNFFNGYIAEIIIFDTALTTAQRASVEAYLAAKWAISGVHAPATASSDPVGYWADKSGNGRHAVQATAGNRPTISATAQNGRKNLSFVQKHLLGSFSPELASTEYTVAAVVQTNTGANNNQRVFATAASTGNDFASGRVIPILNNAQVVGGLSAYASTNVSPVTGFATYGIFTGVLGGGAVRNSINRGRGQSVSATQTTATAKYGVGTAGHQDGTALFTGSIAELLYYSRALSDSEVSRIETYLSNRWGITLAPQVSNADAQDWVNRVYANGGTVSSATAAAVNQFCTDIENAPGGSIRDRFLRLNLFAGTGLNAALVPLYRAASLGDTQLGNTTDTNVGGLFVSGDYSEATGLQGASGKYLNTGFLASTLNRSNTHISIYGTSLTTAPGSFGSLIGARNASAGDIIQFDGKRSVASNTYFSHSGPSLSAEGSPVASSGHLMGVSRTSTDLKVYSNGTSTGSQTSDRTSGTLVNIAMFVFANNFNGTASDISGMLCRQYSIGLGMTAAQVGSYYSAVQAFQTALGRNV
jgi:hypothetical protein